MTAGAPGAGSVQGPDGQGASGGAEYRRAAVDGGFASGRRRRGP